MSLRYTFDRGHASGYTATEVIRMFIKTQFPTMFDYHWHITQQLLVCAAELSEADYYARPENTPLEAT